MPDQNETETAPTLTIRNLSPEICALLGTMPDAALARQFGARSTDVRAARIAAGIPTFRIAYEHGDARRYAKGCRCDECRTANTKRHAEYVAVRKTKNSSIHELLTQVLMLLP